jgi:Tfp pilus assembly protein PilO
MMEFLTQAQKKIMLISGGVLLAFLLFIFIVYTPSKNAVRSIKTELEGIDSQIQAVEVFLSSAGSMADGLERLKERDQYLIDKFPSREEAALQMLSGFAKKLNIEVISVAPGPKEDFLYGNSEKVEIEAKTCRRLLVVLEMKGSYKDLVKYIETIKESLPAYVVIERLKILKNKEDLPKLMITVEMSLYLLS